MTLIDTKLHYLPLNKANRYELTPLIDTRWHDVRLIDTHTIRYHAYVRVVGVYQKITTNIFVIFWDWSWRLQWDLLKSHYKHLRDFWRVSWRPLVRSFGFCSELLSRLGWPFCSILFFGLGMEIVVIGVGHSKFTATKSGPNSPPQIPTPIVKLVKLISVYFFDIFTSKKAQNP